MLQCSSQIRFGLVCFANKNNKNGKLSYSWFQTSQTGGQQYSDTSPLSIPWRIHRLLIMITSIITSITLMKNNATEHCKTFPGPFFHLPPPTSKIFFLELKWKRERRQSEKEQRQEGGIEPRGSSHQSQAPNRYS
jgi:hypothetical protein